MPSWTLDSTHGQTTSGVACYHSHWTANTVERRREWHAIISFGLADTIRRRRAWHAIALGWHTRSNDVGHGMPSWTLDSTHGRKMSGVACHHSPWTTNTVERRRAWHAINAFGLADTIGRHQTWYAIFVLGRQSQSNDVGRGMPSRLWTAHTVGRRRAWHAIIAFGQHKRLDDVGHGMPSPP